MRLIINPANYLWTNKILKSESSDFVSRFMDVFQQPEYKQLLRHDYEILIDDYVNLYQGLFRDALFQINDAELNDASLYVRLEKVTGVKFTEAH
jgi:hypothetical protein